uniref:Uncharacterized protein n=1 Tax=Anguilla anguilla TaxID=7936 RepID=A0A0E9XDI3_ANGAN
MQVKYLCSRVRWQCPTGELNLRPLGYEINSLAIILHCHHLRLYATATPQKPTLHSLLSRKCSFLMFSYLF